MEQIKKLISALSIKQRLTIATAAIFVIASVLYLSRWRMESDFRPIYNALAPEDAAAVVQKLKEAGVEFRLSENGASVLVPSARVAELRLEMASAGLPKSGRIGFELFDKTNLGVTEFAEHVNYGRALEGELERSITSLAEIEQARIHLTFPKDSVFLESKQPGKASVVLRLRPGAKLSPQNVNAIVNLVASAVEGLTPESVALVDSRGILLNRPKKAGDADNPQPSEATLEYRQKIESDLLTKINATLEPLIGPEKFRAGVSVDCDFTSGEQSEESIDPTKSVMLTSQKTEENTGATTTSGTPGTAANLPRPPTKTGSGSGGVSRRSENISYQTSRTVRHVRLPQGTVKRISISVLVDNDLKWEGPALKQKRVLVAPTPARLKTIRDLVAGVTGLNTERGDQLIVETLPFEATMTAEPPSSLPSSSPALDPRIPKWLQPLISNPKNLIIACIAALVIPLLLIVWIFLIKRKPKLTVEAPLTLPESSQSDLENALESSLPKDQIQLETLAQAALPKATTNKSEILLKNIRESIKADNASTINVLRTWMSDTKGSGDSA